MPEEKIVAITSKAEELEAIRRLKRELEDEIRRKNPFSSEKPIERGKVQSFLKMVLRWIELEDIEGSRWDDLAPEAKILDEKLRKGT